MIDWKKESATKDYCGWCDDTPTGGSCQGDCFVRKDYTNEQILQNKLDHLKIKLKEIPLLKKQLRQREKDLREELEILYKNK